MVLWAQLGDVAHAEQRAGALGARLHGLALVRGDAAALPAGSVFLDQRHLARVADRRGHLARHLGRIAVEPGHAATGDARRRLGPAQLAALVLEAHGRTRHRVLGGRDPHAAAAVREHLAVAVDLALWLRRARATGSAGAPAAAAGRAGSAGATTGPAAAAAHARRAAGAAASPGRAATAAGAARAATRAAAAPAAAAGVVLRLTTAADHQQTESKQSRRPAHLRPPWRPA